VQQDPFQPDVVVTTMFSQMLLGSPWRKAVVIAGAVASLGS